MKIINPLQINNWGFKEFLTVVVVVQLAVWVMIGTGLYHDITVLWQVLAFVYLTLIPGLIILRILKLHKLDTTSVIIYSVGLSIASLMFTAFFMNVVFPLFGIFHPISFDTLICSISVLIAILTFFSYLRDRSFSSPDNMFLEETLSPNILVLFLFPLLAITGTYLFDTEGNNALLMISLLLIAFVPVMIYFTKFFKESDYPFIIFILAITLLYSHSLISPFIWGWDINKEYYVANTVIQNGIWDPSVFSNLNGMLSLTMLAPIYFLILNMDLDGIFKIIYPFLFALVPLGLYKIFRKQTNSKIAFLACFFFISFFTFYIEMLTLARQEIAELFVVLIILSLLDDNLDKLSKSVFFIVFSLSLIVSHYGISYLFLLILLVVWTIGIIGKVILSRKFVDNLFVWIKEKTGNQNLIDLQKDISQQYPLRFFYILFFGIFSLSWYIYTSHTSIFYSIVMIADRIVSGLFSPDEFLNPETTQGLALATISQLTIIHEIGKYIHYLTIILIVIGFLGSMIFYRKNTISILFLSLSFGALCLCGGSLVLPFFSSSFNTQRVYQFCLVILAPFCILGGITILQRISIYFGIKNIEKISFQVLSVFFAVFLLFNSSWIYEITNDEPIGLLNSSVDFPSIYIPQAAGAEWLAKSADAKSIYADIYRKLFFSRFFGERDTRRLPDDPSLIPEKSYVFLGDYNIKNHKALFYLYLEPWNPNYILTNRSRIYDNGGAEVYYR